MSKLILRAYLRRLDAAWVDQHLARQFDAFGKAAFGPRRPTTSTLPSSTCTSCP